MRICSKSTYKCLQNRPFDAASVRINYLWIFDKKLPAALGPGQVTVILKKMFGDAKDSHFHFRLIDFSNNRISEYAVNHAAMSAQFRGRWHSVDYGCGLSCPNCNIHEW